MKYYCRFHAGVAIWLCLFGIGLLFFTPKATAAPIGISITPLKYDLQANPGDVLDQQVTAVNPNSFAIFVVPEFQDFKMEENGITFIPPGADNPWKMSDWIRIQTDPIRLAPKGYYDVPFSVVVPKNAGAGGHYAAVFFKIVGQESGEGFGATARVGALILLNVLGEVHKPGEFLKFQTPLLWSKGPVELKATFKNTGTAHYDIQAKVALYNFLGFKKYSLVSETRFITPEQIRHLTAKWEKKWPLGVFKAVATIIDGDGAAHSKTLWFIGFPWQWALIGLAILALLYLIFQILKKKFKIVKVK